MSNSPSRHRKAFRPASWTGGRGSSRLRRHVVAGDMTAATVAWGLPLLLHSQTGWSKSIAESLAAVSLTLITFNLGGLYRSWVCSEVSRQTARIATGAAVGGLALTTSEWLAGSVSAARITVGTIASASLVVAARWRFVRWLKHKRAEGQFQRTVVLVGTNQDAAAIWQTLQDEPELGYRVAGVLGPEAGQPQWTRLPSRVSVHDLVLLAEDVAADGVILVGSAISAEESSRAARDCLRAGIHVELWPGLSGVMSTRVHIAPVCGIPMLYIEPHSPPLWQVAAKRAIDIAVAVALLPVATPVLLLMAVLIRLEDGGSVIYCHSVIGRYGKPMEVLKLRTMVPDASRLLGNVAALNERKGGPLFKATNDPRVTRVGHILRATSIDELPQLWDVLAGRMSLVGPRFALPKEVAQFDEELQRRTAMRPGMTGLWQTEARDNPSFSAYRRLDLLYVDNWSLRMDLAILANTAHAVTVRAVRAVLPWKKYRTSNPATTAPAQSGVETSGAEIC